MSSLPPSFRLNNQACVLIRQGRYTEASTLLRRALLLTKREMEVLQQSRSRSPVHHDDFKLQGQQSSAANEEVVITPSLDNDVVMMDVDSQDEEEEAYDVSSHYVYAQPVFLNKICGEHFFNDRSFAITFNLAIASHLMSIQQERQGGEETLALRSKTLAKSLYGLAMQIQGSEVFGQHLPAAILNNMSGVCSDPQEAQRYDELLLSALFLHVGTGNVSAPDSQVYLAKFLGNVSYLLGSTDIASAA